MPKREVGPTKKLKATKKRKLILLAEKCAQFLKSKYKVKRVILIGSLVKGFFHDRSDIDLVVEGLAPELYIKALTELYDLLPQGVELNLIPYEDAFDTLKDKTIKEGKLIYG
ncbi:MAG: nucleotidyltransferase family protein [Candidatus Zixiibacteriota bacterium]